MKANGQHSPKVFRVKDVEVSKGERLVISKRQAFRPMTTRVLYPGIHWAQLVVNGKVVAKDKFEFLG